MNINQELKEQKKKEFDNRLEIQGLRKVEFVKEIEVENLNEHITKIEEHNKEFKTAVKDLDQKNVIYENRVNEMNSILSTILVQLNKLKAEQISLKKELENTKQENEFLKDKHGIDLSDLTPRPNWRDLQDRYGLVEKETGKSK